jgi:hypothetical protein
MRIKHKLLCLSAICLTVACGSVWADAVITLPVANPSFEITNSLTYTCAGPETCAFNGGPIPGWTINAGPGSSAGSWQPSSSYFNLPLPDGNVVAFLNVASISQTLGETLQPNSNYTLSVYVGHRLDGWPANYTIALNAGGTNLATLTGNNGDIPLGTFAKQILTFSTGTVVTIPGDLQIVLSSDNAQTDFDNVSLTYIDPPPPGDDVATVPEPASLALFGTGMVGLAGILRRKVRK